MLTAYHCETLVRVKSSISQHSYTVKIVKVMGDLLSLKLDKFDVNETELEG